jgi:hypothetical protein
MQNPLERLVQRAEALMARIESVLPQPMSALDSAHAAHAVTVSLARSGLRTCRSTVVPGRFKGRCHSH